MASLIGRIGNELGVKTPEERDYYKSARALMGNMSRAQARRARKTLGMSKGEFSDYVGTLIPQTEISDADMSGLEMPVAAQPELKLVNYFEEELDPADEVVVPKPTLNKRIDKGPVYTSSFKYGKSSGLGKAADGQQYIANMGATDFNKFVELAKAEGEVIPVVEGLKVKTDADKAAEQKAALNKAVNSTNPKDGWLNFYHKYWNSNNSGTMGRSGRLYLSTR